jgi:hypothetical protein
MGADRLSVLPERSFFKQSPSTIFSIRLIELRSLDESDSVDLQGIETESVLSSFKFTRYGASSIAETS